MDFANKWRTYRMDKLNLTSKEVAYSLGVKPAAYSNYELGKRPFPVDLLLKLQKTFDLSDDQLLSLFHDDEPRRTHLSENQIQYELTAIRNRYRKQFGEDLLPFIIENKQLLNYLMLLKNNPFTPQERRQLLIQAIAAAEQLHKNK